MPKYIFVYKEDQPTDMSQIPEEEVKKMMEAWGEWLGNIGAGVVDGGDAFKPGGKVVSSSAVEDADDLSSGYTIVEAKDFDEALEYAKGCPSVAEGTKVEVYEAFGL